MDGILIYLIILALLIWFWWFMANQFYEAAKAKGYHAKKYFWICFWFGILGYMLVIALPDRGSNMTDRSYTPGALYDDLPDL